MIDRSFPALFPPSPETIATLNAYDWPGNVRELKPSLTAWPQWSSAGAAHDAPSALDQARRASMIEHWPGGGDGEPLHEEFLPRPAPANIHPGKPKAGIVRALAASHGERGRAAAILEIGRATLYRKMKQYGLD